MMNIIEAHLRNDLTDYRRAKNQDMVTLISTVLGECTRKVKEPTEAECVKTIATIVENMEFTLEKKGLDLKLVNDITYLSDFLPQMLRDDEIVDIIKMNNFVALKDFMAYMKVSNANRYDGKNAKTLFEQHHANS